MLAARDLHATPIARITTFVQRVLPLARRGITDAWGHSMLVALLGALTLAVVWPIRSLVLPGAPTGTRLAVEPMPSPDAGAGWSSAVRFPADVRNTAVSELFDLVTLMGWAALALAGVTILVSALARSSARGAELAVHRAVGASRRDVIGTLALEGGAVAAALLALGLGAAWVGAGLAAAGWPGVLARAPSWPWVTPLIALAFVVAAALLPARFAYRRRVTGHEPHVGLALPATQLAASLAILTASSQVSDRAARIIGDPEAAATSGIVLSLDSGLRDARDRGARYERLLDDLARDPRVAAASLTSAGATLGLGAVDRILTECGNCVRTQVVVRWMPLDAVHLFVSADTFATLRLPIVQGRVFDRADARAERPVAVVNRHVAGRYYERGQAVGRGLYLRSGWPGPPPYTVIGVVDDERAPALGGGHQPREVVYLNVLRHPPRHAELVLVPARDTSRPALTARAERLAAAHGLTVTEPSSITELRARESELLGWFGTWLGLVGLAAALAAGGGVCWAVAMWVRAQAPEVAIRRAVGASRRTVVAFVLGRTAVMGGVGAIGGVLAYFVLLRRPLGTAVGSLPGVAWDRIGWIAAALLGVALAGALASVAPEVRGPPSARLD